MKRLGVVSVSVLVSSIFACASSDGDGTGQESGAGNEVSASATTVEQLFANVAPGAPVCFAKAYSAPHLGSHPSQTIRAIRVELSQPAPDTLGTVERLARITFQQNGSGGPKIRELTCVNKTGSVVCEEEQGCVSSVEVLSRGGNGIRVVNKQLRASGACDETPKPLDGSAGADDVFDLPVLTSCAQGELANIPTVDCDLALQANEIRTCIDVFPDPNCTNTITKGTRWTDEGQLSMVQGKRLESEEACIQRYSDPALGDGCCGG